MKRILKRLLILAFVVCLICEASIRHSELLDFPIYTIDSEIGYLQNANQSGSFLNKNRWSINDKHLFGVPYYQTNGNCIFLIGDSVVWGGNPYRFEDRLGVVLEKMSHRKVWTASAGSWSSWSEAAYIRRFRSVVEDSDYLVWILNTGDFFEKTVWNSELTHPTHRPLLGLAYVLQKYLMPMLKKGEFPAASLAVDKSQLRRINELIVDLSKTKKNILVVLWPSKRELLSDRKDDLVYSSIRKSLQTIQSDKVQLEDIADSGHITTALYKDDIHPSPAGTRILAQIINTKLGRTDGP